MIALRAASRGESGRVGMYRRSGRAVSSATVIAITRQAGSSASDGGACAVRLTPVGVFFLRGGAGRAVGALMRARVFGGESEVSRSRRWRVRVAAVAASVLPCVSGDLLSRDAAQGWSH